MNEKNNIQKALAAIQEDSELFKSSSADSIAYKFVFNNFLM